MPAGALKATLMNEKDIEFLYKNPCTKYPGFDYSRIKMFNFSGQESFVAYNRIIRMSRLKVKIQNQ